MVKEYKFQGETFQIDDSGCDGSSEWEMKVSDGEGTVLITPHITRHSQYMAVFPGQAQTTSDTPEGALDDACRLLINYRPVDLPTPEYAGKALCDFVDKL